jgi:hypothetical protein
MFAALSVVLALGATQAFSSPIKPIFNGELKLQTDLPELAPTVYADQDVPASWDWRAKGLMTTDLNQHIPVYW